jgi:hypothetical protein
MLSARIEKLARFEGLVERACLQDPEIAKSISRGSTAWATELAKKG